MSSDWSIQKPASFLAGKMSRVQIKRKGLLETALEKNPERSEASLVGYHHNRERLGNKVTIILIYGNS